MIRRYVDTHRPAETATTGIFVIREGEEFGPFSAQDAKALLQAGTLAANDLVKIGIAGRPFPAGILFSED